MDLLNICLGHDTLDVVRCLIELTCQCCCVETQAVMVTPLQ